MPSKSSRRSFIKKAIGTAIVGSAPTILSAGPDFVGAGSKSGKTQLLSLPDRELKTYTANDQVNVGVIGMGIMGHSNAATSVQIPGVKLVAFCDLYTGRLDHAKELYGADVFTTKNYHDILDRKDIDAVIVATSDNWHDRICIDAMNKGKHVYCEKPMVHKLDQGAEVIATQKKTGKVFQVGSQRASSIATEKARELFESGIIGELVLAETHNDRHSPNGAWQYSIPTDANTGTVDWERFNSIGTKMAYDPIRFFRWRNYQDYGTGMAGDLFVHLFTALHCITSSTGPNRIYATGGLRYWKDGRDVPDIFTSIFDYPQSPKHPAFTLQMRVNFVDGAGGSEDVRIVGSDGMIQLGWDGVRVVRKKMAKDPGFGGWDTFGTFSTAQQKEYEQWYKAKYPARRPEMVEPDLEFKTPRGYSSDIDHHLNFYKGIREKAPIKEDALFGMRAGGPSLAGNKSYFEKKVMYWDPENAKLVQSV